MPALSGPTLAPASRQNAKSAAIFLHGYGSSGDDLIGLAPYFARSLPDTVFYSPHAPEPWEGGFFGGKQWFSLAGYDPEAVRRDPNQMGGIFQRMFDGAEKAAVILNQFIDEITAQHKLNANQVALIGFSQGTMMALHVGFRRTQALAGIVGFSGAMVGGSKLKTDLKSRPPVLLVHGNADPVVPVESIDVIKSVLSENNVPFEAHIIPGLQHGIDDSGIILATNFLKTKLA
ncbi:MAG: phospholipase [Rhodospirillaceae bacterium]|nr:phospholipase [Rhodospirillaceae bacterium]